jgi:raffinose/stachyose/melibiose transport system permease protein
LKPDTKTIRRLKKKAGLFFRVALCWAGSLVVLIPFWIVLVNSLKTKGQADAMNYHLPLDPQFINYLNVIKQGNMLRAFFNSLLIAAGCTIIGIIISAMAAFVIYRNRKMIHKICFYLFFLGLIAPINYVTTIRAMRFLGIINTYQGIILLYSAMAIPFAFFLFYNFMATIPREIDEAAIVDGVKTRHLFFVIIFPLLRPVAVTGSVLTFISAWNDFISPLYVLNRSSRWGMIISVYNFWGTYIHQWNLICAVIVLSLLPILALYIVSQKYIIAGMTSGAIKG